MPQAFSLAALAAALPSVMAAYQGFNYGAVKPDGNLKQQADFENEFGIAQALVGAPGTRFTSARLYTTIQGGTDISPISAIPAAISTNTTLLLGIWASAGALIVDNELAALSNAIKQYGDAFVRLVAGISVGSEDLYRNSPTGMANGENPGTDPEVLVAYIKKTRDTIAGTKLSGKPVGHVDTWTAWVNSSNQVVTNACDWIGMDAYPYFQSKVSNAIQYNKGLFEDALGQTQAAVGNKPVWITETGFPVTGNTSGDAIPSIENAKTFWDQVGCPRFGYTNIWWYTLQDHSGPLQLGKVSFGIVGGELTSKPLFDISCGDAKVPLPEPHPSNPPPSESTTVPEPRPNNPPPLESTTMPQPPPNNPLPSESTTMPEPRPNNPPPLESTIVPEPRPGNSPPLEPTAVPISSSSSVAVAARSGAVSSSSTEVPPLSANTDGPASATSTPNPSNSTVLPSNEAFGMSDSTNAAIGVALLAVVFAMFAA